MPFHHLVGIALNLQIALGSIIILTILILPVQEHFVSFYLFASSLISFISILQFSEYRSFTSLLFIVQLPSHIRLFETPWTEACQTYLSLTISWSLPKFMSMALVMPSSHLILWCPFLLLPSIFPTIRDFSSELPISIRLKGCCWIMQRRWDSWPLEEMNSIWGQRWGLIAQSFCVIKFY